MWRDRKLMLLMLAALVVRGGVLVVRSQGLKKDPDAYREVAEFLQTDKMFGTNAYWGLLVGDEQLPTANRPPLYPVLLAACGIDRTDGAITIGLLHLVIGLCTIWLMVVLARNWRLEAGALVAGALVAVDPILLNQSAEVMTETLATLLAVGLLLTLSADEFTVRRTLLAGFIGGLAALCRPAFLPMVVLVPGVMLWRMRAQAHVWRSTAVFAIGAFVALSPWAIRNQYTFGRPVVTTTHGGFTLLLGNNPVFYDSLRKESWWTAWHGEEQFQWWLWGNYMDADIKIPSKSAREWILDEVNYELAFNAIADDPGGFALACVYRMTSLWGVVPRQTTQDESTARRTMRWGVGVFYLAEFALAICGIWAIGRRFVQLPWLWGLLLVTVFTAVHLYYWTDLRMRAPLVPVIALCAAAGWEYWRNRPNADRQDSLD